MTTEFLTVEALARMDDAARQDAIELASLRLAVRLAYKALRRDQVARAEQILKEASR